MFPSRGLLKNLLNKVDLLGIKTDTKINKIKKSDDQSLVSPVGEVSGKFSDENATIKKISREIKYYDEQKEIIENEAVKTVDLVKVFPAQSDSNACEIQLEEDQENIDLTNKVEALKSKIEEFRKNSNITIGKEGGYLTLMIRVKNETLSFRCVVSDGSMKSILNFDKFFHVQRIPQL